MMNNYDWFCEIENCVEGVLCWVCEYIEGWWIVGSVGLMIDKMWLNIKILISNWIQFKCKLILTDKNRNNTIN